DGKQLAFVSNKEGNTEITFQDALTAKRDGLAVQSRRYLKPRGVLKISIRNSETLESAARITVTDAKGRSYAPGECWFYADDGFDRKERALEAHYFYSNCRDSGVDVPIGATTVTVVSGYSNRVEARTVNVTADGKQENFVIRPLAKLDESGGK